MTAINPTLLWGLLAFALPILIHFLLKEKPKHIEIPTLKFLQKAIERSSKISRFKNLLLLLLRCFIICLVVTILVRPHLEGKKADTGAARAVMIFIDNNYYSAQRFGTKTQIELAKEKAQKIIANLPDGSLVYLSSFADQENFFEADQQRVKEKLTEIYSENLSTIADQFISERLPLLDQKKHADLAKELHIISDFNQSIKLDEIRQSIPKDSKIQIVLHPIKKREKNLYISQFNMPEEHELKVNQALNFQASLAGGEDLNGAKVRFKLNDKVISEKVISQINSEGRASVDFNHTFLESGPFQGEIEIIKSDQLSLDNSHYFAGEIAGPKKILILNQSDEKISQAQILGLALTPSSWTGKQIYDIEIKAYFDLTAELPLFDYSAIILSGTLALDNKQIHLIRKHFEQGGKILIYPELGHSLEKANETIYALTQKSLKHSEANNKFSADTRYAFARTLARQVDEQLTKSSFSDYFYLYSHDKSNFKDNDILLRDKKDRAILLREYSNEGELTFFGLSSNLKHKNFLGKDCYAPTIHTLIKELSRAETIPKNYLCNDAINLALNHSVSRCNIISPDGSRSEIKLQSGDSSRLYVYTDSQETGIYQSSHPKLKKFACNLQILEDFYKYPESKGTKAKDKNSAKDTIKTVEDEDTFSQKILSEESLLRIFISLCLLLMTSEIFLGNRSKIK